MAADADRQAAHRHKWPPAIAQRLIQQGSRAATGRELPLGMHVFAPGRRNLDKGELLGTGV